MGISLSNQIYLPSETLRGLRGFGVGVVVVASVVFVVVAVVCGEHLSRIGLVQFGFIVLLISHVVCSFVSRYCCSRVILQVHCVIVLVVCEFISRLLLVRFVCRVFWIVDVVFGVSFSIDCMFCHAVCAHRFCVGLMRFVVAFNVVVFACRVCSCHRIRFVLMLRSQRW